MDDGLTRLDNGLTRIAVGLIMFNALVPWLDDAE